MALPWQGGCGIKEPSRSEGKTQRWQLQFAFQALAASFTKRGAQRNHRASHRCTHENYFLSQTHNVPGSEESLLRRAGTEKTSRVELVVTFSSPLSTRQWHSCSAVNVLKSLQEGGSDNSPWAAGAKRGRKPSTEKRLYTLYISYLSGRKRSLFFVF